MTDHWEKPLGREGKIGWRLTHRDPYRTIESDTGDMVLVFAMRFPLEGKPPITKLTAIDDGADGVVAVKDLDLLFLWTYLTQAVVRDVGKRPETEIIARCIIELADLMAKKVGKGK